MTEHDIVTILDALASLRDVAANLAAQKTTQIESYIPDYVKADIALVEQQFTPQIASVNAQIAELENAVKANILEYKGSVKGARLHAIWSRGRSSWASDKLLGYAVAHPEIKAFYKEGEPSVSIRAVASNGKGEH